VSQKNIFVLGLTEIQRGELETVLDADRYAFHSLLDTERLVDTEKIVFHELLDQAHAQLDDFRGSVDAIIAHWDFPTSVLAPILARERGLPAPELKSVLACEDKYWSRLTQREAVPECVPDFAVFDPFTDDPLADIGLEFPFWVKPVKSFASQLGFQIDDADEFADALERIREEIGRVGSPFDEVLDMVELPPEVAATTGTSCLAERVISGVQAAPEGAMSGGRFTVHGVFDMLKDESGHSFSRLEYPSALSEEVQERMISLSERYLRHIGYDDACFNAEFLWDEADDQLWLVEVNTRISQSHSDLFAKVDGVSNHEIAIDVALGRMPAMPQRGGPFTVAAQCHIPWRRDGDGILKRVPTDEEIEQLAERHPETVVELGVEEGDRLSELRNQDSYRYDFGVIYLGADDREQLEERYQACLDELQFEVEPVDGG
jgi:biotin carboxylase